MPVKQLRELHDARLVGITYLKNSEIRLDFERPDSTRKSLTLSGVAHFF